jgi:hypothetical protein
MEEIDNPSTKELVKCNNISGNALGLLVIRNKN